MKERELITYGTAANFSEARAIASAEAQKRYGRLALDKLEQGVQAEYGRVRLYASRMFNSAVELGLRLIELKRRSPHGAFEGACERLGISKTAAHRFRELAEARPLLPAEPPDGGVWSIDRALTYSKTAAEFVDDVDALNTEDLKTKVAAKLAHKRKVKASAQLAGAIVKLESQIRQALAEGDVGALAAIDMIASTARRLEDDAKRYADDADRMRAQDEAA
jgi:hypothetical protein